MLPEQFQELERAFPSLLHEGYTLTSPYNPLYNCIAWAAEVNHQWWQPDPLGQYFWPQGVERVSTAAAYIKAYSTIGYAICTTAEYEEGFEKIAIFTNTLGTPTHAARQIAPEVWTSKLGKAHDISHTLAGLVGQIYGEPTIFLKRKKAAV